jgi:hypothetical protein
MLTVVFSLEADDRAAKKPLEQLPAPWARRIVTWIRPGDMPEGDDGAQWEALANELGGEREVIIVDEDKRPIAFHLLTHGGTARRGIFVRCRFSEEDRAVRAGESIFE